MTREKRNRVGSAGFAAPLLGLCLFLGCTPQQPAANQYRDAVALREQGQNQLAVDRLNEAIKADPDFAPAYSELGKAYQGLGEYDKAMAAFRQAVKLEPESFESQMNLAGTYEKLDRYPQAADAYGRAVELDPNSTEALAGAAGSCVKAGRYAKAQAYCEQAGPDRAIERFLPMLAQAYEGQKDYQRAIEIYQRLLTPDKPDPNVLVALGVACVKVERYDRAREVLVSATQLRPQDGTAWRHLGFCLIKLGDLDQAMQTYQRSVDLNGGDWEAYRGLGVACMLKAGQTQDDRWRVQGLQHWRRSLLVNPDQPRRQVLEKLIRENAKQLSPMQGLSD